MSLNRTFRREDTEIQDDDDDKDFVVQSTAPASNNNRKPTLITTVKDDPTKKNFYIPTSKSISVLLLRILESRLMLL